MEFLSLMVKYSSIPSIQYSLVVYKVFSAMVAELSIQNYKTSCIMQYFSNIFQLEYFKNQASFP